MEKKNISDFFGGGGVDSIWAQSRGKTRRADPLIRMNFLGFARHLAPPKSDTLPNSRMLMRISRESFDIALLLNEVFKNQALSPNFQISVRISENVFQKSDKES